MDDPNLMPNAAGGAVDQENMTSVSPSKRTVVLGVVNTSGMKSVNLSRKRRWDQPPEESCDIPCIKKVHLSDSPVCEESPDSTPCSDTTLSRLGGNNSNLLDQSDSASYNDSRGDEFVPDQSTPLDHSSSQLCDRLSPCVDSGGSEVSSFSEQNASERTNTNVSVSGLSESVRDEKINSCSPESRLDVSEKPMKSDIPDSNKQKSSGNTNNAITVISHQSAELQRIMCSYDESSTESDGSNSNVLSTSINRVEGTNKDEKEDCQSSLTNSLNEVNVFSNQLNLEGAENSMIVTDRLSCPTDKGIDSSHKNILDGTDAFNAKRGASFELEATCKNELESHSNIPNLKEPVKSSIDEISCNDTSIPLPNPNQCMLVTDRLTCVTDAPNPEIHNIDSTSSDPTLLAVSEKTFQANDTESVVVQKENNIVISPKISNDDTIPPPIDNTIVLQQVTPSIVEASGGEDLDSSSHLTGLLENNIDAVKDSSRSDDLCIMECESTAITEPCSDEASDNSLTPNIQNSETVASEIISDTENVNNAYLSENTDTANKLLVCNTSDVSNQIDNPEGRSSPLDEALENTPNNAFSHENTILKLTEEKISESQCSTDQSDICEAVNETPVSEDIEPNAVEMNLDQERSTLIEVKDDIDSSVKTPHPLDANESLVTPEFETLQETCSTPLPTSLSNVGIETSVDENCTPTENLALNNNVLNVNAKDEAVSPSVLEETMHDNSQQPRVDGSLTDNLDETGERSSVSCDEQLSNDNISRSSYPEVEDTQPPTDQVPNHNLVDSSQEIPNEEKSFKVNYPAVDKTEVGLLSSNNIDPLVMQVIFGSSGDKSQGRDEADDDSLSMQSTFDSDSNTGSNINLPETANTPRSTSPPFKSLIKEDGPGNDLENKVTHNEIEDCQIVKNSLLNEQPINDVSDECGSIPEEKDKISSISSSSKVDFAERLNEIHEKVAHVDVEPPEPVCETSPQIESMASETIAESPKSVEDYKESAETSFNVNTTSENCKEILETDLYTPDRVRDATSEPLNEVFDTTEDLSGEMSSNQPLDSKSNELTSHNSDGESHKSESPVISAPQENKLKEEIVKPPITEESNQIPGSPPMLLVKTSETKSADISPDELNHESTSELVESSDNAHNCLSADLNEMSDESEVKKENSILNVSDSENTNAQEAIANECEAEVCTMNYDNSKGIESEIKDPEEFDSQNITETVKEVSVEPVVEAEESSVPAILDSEEVPEVSKESTTISNDSEIVPETISAESTILLSDSNKNQDNSSSSSCAPCAKPTELGGDAAPNDFEEPMDIEESVTLISEEAKIEPSIVVMEEEDDNVNSINDNSSMKMNSPVEPTSEISVEPLVNNISENVDKEVTEEIESYDVVEEVVTCESPESDKNMENELDEVVDDGDDDNDNDEITVRSPPSLASEETLETVHESIGNSDHIEAVIENDTSDLRESDIDNQNEVFIESEVSVDVESFSPAMLKKRDENFEKDILLNSLRNEFPSRKRDSSAVNSITNPNVSFKKEMDAEESSDLLPPESKKRRVENSDNSSMNAVISDSKVLKDLAHSEIPLLKTVSSPIMQKNEGVLHSELSPHSVDKESSGSKLEPITLRIYKDNLSIKTDDLDSPKRNKSPKFSSEILNQAAHSPNQKGPLSPQTKQLEFTLKIAKDMNTNQPKATMSPKNSMSPSSSWKLDSGSLSPSSPGESGILKLKLTKPSSPSFSKDSPEFGKTNDLVASQSTELPKPSLEIGSVLKKMIESEKAAETKTEGSILEKALISESPLTNSIIKKRGRPRKIIMPTPEAEGNVVNHSPTTPGDSPSLDTSGDSEQSNRQVRSCRARTQPIVVKTRKPRGGGVGRGGGRGGAKGVARPITSEKEAEKIQEKLSEYEKAELAKIEARKEKMRLDRIAKNEAKKAKKLAKKLKDEERRKRLAAEKAEKAAAAAPQVFEEETRMSAPGSRGHTPAPPSLQARLNQASENPEESQSSISTPNSINKKGRMEIPIDPESDDVRVDQLAEYQWQGSELCMIQEQVSLYLGVKSFKRKYPDLKRRVVEAEERTFLEDSGLVPKSMCDLGLTAVSSAEVLDIMFHDFHEKYEEFRGYMREKESREYSFKQKALSAKVGDKSKGEPRELALEAVAMWNLNLNRDRKEERRCALDLQTFTVHYPKSTREKMQRPGLRPGLYPVPVIPGQFSDYYKTYTPTELMYFPLNTVMYGPLKPNERRPDHSDGSDSSSSSSDDSSCGSDSEDEDNSSKECKICNGEKKSTSEAHPEILLQCSQCKGLCHPTCQEITPEMLPHIKKYSWHCSNCKTCVQCKNAEKEEKKLFCDLCDRGYHLSCVGLKTSPEGRWHCSVCSFCTICGSKDPGGPEWHYEYKKTDKGVRLYQRTLCVPCGKTALL